MIDREIQEQSKKHRITTAGQMRKSISDSGSQQTWEGLKLRAQDPSQYTAENYSLLTKLGGGYLAHAQWCD